MGFQSPTYTLIPKVVADSLMQDLTTGELRCLLYILGHTFGWKKYTDQISISQFMHGIKSKEGEVKDLGVGLSKNALLKSLSFLEGKKLIHRKRRMTRMGDCDATEFSINLFIEKNSISKHSWPWKRAAFFQVPDELFKSFLSTLSGNELKTLLFVARWTSHTENQVSQISIRQMTKGIVKEGGEILSKGTGISDSKNLMKIVRALEQKRMLCRKSVSHVSKGFMANEYSLFQEGEGVENKPTLQGVISAPTQGVETNPTNGVNKIPTLGVKIEPTHGVEKKPDTIITFTKEDLNTISKELTQKFYKSLGIKASSKKIEKEKKVIFELLEKDKFTPEQIEISFPWVARKFPDTFHIHRLPMLIGQALRGVNLSQRVIKTSPNPLEDQKQNEESSRKKIQEFEKLPADLQKFWISKAPKIFTGETAKKGWAIGHFFQNQEQKLGI